MAPASADDDDRKQTINLAKSILLKALLATSVVVAGAKIKALALPSTTADGRRIGFVVWLTEALVTADDTLGANAENGIVVSA